MLFFLALFYKDSAILPDLPICNVPTPPLLFTLSSYTWARDAVPITKTLNQLSSDAKTPEVKSVPRQHHGRRRRSSCAGPIHEYGSAGPV